MRTFTRPLISDAHLRQRLCLCPLWLDYGFQCPQSHRQTTLISNWATIISKILKAWKIPPVKTWQSEFGNA